MLKTHQNHWRLGLCPRPRWGSLQRSHWGSLQRSHWGAYSAPPDPLAVMGWDQDLVAPTWWCPSTFRECPSNVLLLAKGLNERFKINHDDDEFM